MKFRVLTIFPELIEEYARWGLLSKAQSSGLLSVEARQLRDHAINTQGQVDDMPYGGGSGMLLRVDTAAAAIREAKAELPKAKVITFSPRGRKLDAAFAKELSQEDSLIMLPYRYEGHDQRIVDSFVDHEVSLGDFVLMGGELASMALIEASARFIPGVLGNPESAEDESFQSNAAADGLRLLEHPQYTRPQEFEGMEVPEVLLSGNHQKVAEWRETRAKKDSAKYRPDLFTDLKKLPEAELSVALIHYPVLNKHQEIVTTSITNLDIHDIARSARTFGLASYYIVHPTKALRRLAEKVCEHWDTGYGSTYNKNRSEALSRINVLSHFDEVLSDIERRCGKPPKLIVTSARPDPSTISFEDMRATLAVSDEPHLMLLGTGWGLADEIMERADYRLEPVCGYTDYNHLSVRAAAAIMFSKLLGA